MTPLRMALAISLFAVAGLAGGCSSMDGLGTTSSITPAETPAVAAVPAEPPKPIKPNVASMSCESLKDEMTAFTAAKVPQRLAQFGQSKYTPTPDETAEFSRYVEVNQASKARCTPKKAEAPAKKKTVAAATPAVTATVATKKAAAPATKKKPVATTTAGSVIETQPMPAVVPASDGVTVTVQ